MEFHFQSPSPFQQQHTPKVLKSPKPKGQQPKAVPRGGGAKFVGVRQRPSGRWVAEIKDTTQKIRMWLGTFETAEEAAHAYDEAACLIRGVNTRTNFGANPVSAANSPLALRIRNLLNSRSKPGKPRRPAPPPPPPPFSTTLFPSAVAGSKISQAIGSLEGASGYPSCRPQFSTSDANQSNVGVSDLAQFPTYMRWVMDPSGIEPVLYVPSGQDVVQETNFGAQMGAYMYDINGDYGGGNGMVHDHVSEGIWDLHSHLFSCQS